MAPVVRVGETVRRVTGPWTRAVHALLRHLEAVGFDGAPRVHGFDDDGREILDFVPGEVQWPTMGVLRTDDGLARGADLLRRYHEAVTTFVPPVDAAWRFPDMATDVDSSILAGEPRIICHNDCAAWNLVAGGDRWAFIDWDTAGPRPRMWDVAYAVRGMILVDPESDIGHRVNVFCDAYGLDAVERAHLPAIVVSRISSSIDGMRRRAEAGEEPWARLWHGGHREAWESTLALAKRVLR